MYSRRKNCVFRLMFSILLFQSLAYAKVSDGHQGLIKANEDSWIANSDDEDFTLDHEGSGSGCGQYDTEQIVCDCSILEKYTMCRNHCSEVMCSSLYGECLSVYTNEQCSSGTTDYLERQADDIMDKPQTTNDNSDAFGLSLHALVLKKKFFKVEGTPCGILLPVVAPPVDRSGRKTTILVGDHTCYLWISIGAGMFFVGAGTLALIGYLFLRRRNLRDEQPKSNEKKDLRVQRTYEHYTRKNEAEDDCYSGLGRTENDYEEPVQKQNIQGKKFHNGLYETPASAVVNVTENPYECVGQDTDHTPHSDV